MIVNTIHAARGKKHTPSNIHTAIAAISKLVPCPMRICSETIVANNGIVKSKLRTEIMINEMIPKTQFLLFILISIFLQAKPLSILTKNSTESCRCCYLLWKKTQEMIQMFHASLKKMFH